MTVDSYLELYTTLYGWALAGVVRDILVDTGLVFAPFVVILLGTWLKSHQSSAIDGGDAAWMVRAMEVQLFTTFAVIMLCFMPLMPLSAVNIQYTPVADAQNANPTTATPVSPDSSGYAAAFANPPASVDVPFWWFGVMSTSAGFNHAMRGGVAGASSNLAGVEALGMSLSIADPALRAESIRFVRECFEPARTLFNQQPVSAQAAAAIANYGDDDPDWMGSHAFLDDPTLYPSLRAAAPVAGFAVDVTGDDADLASNAALPQWSRPNCSKWWTDGNNGLKDRMVAGSDSGPLLDNIFGSLFLAVASDERTDAIARRVERVNVPLVPDNPGSSESSGFFQQAIGAYGVVGEGWKAWASAPMIMLFAQTAQPIILLAMYMFLPLVLLFDRFSFRSMFLGAIAIFSVKSWTAWWFIANWLYDHMLVAMYPTALNLMSAILQLQLDDAMKRVVVNTVLIAMYIGFPLIWSSMLGIVGLQVANGISAVAGRSLASGATAGGAGAALGASVGKGAARIGGRGAVGAGRLAARRLMRR
ncbi:conjugal transfer protein TraG N-terminal domain-containing protein [Nitrogeniibacter aestuarii]|uniref:conjugal transfer protein TraG N-terminal domain-containing protein n=1 Tax=Nitrogeniibacter aestuarii TaxID=2815343 RepID=UPI001E502A44|nr:conjugal transfer protein TraG N-terminal domain-containing protein [Nitrogeniibacter aestuarii]